MISLVGYTGFVGSNIYEYGNVDMGYNSSNIADAYGTMPEILIYAGVRAEKYLANENPEMDRMGILEAKSNIEKIAPRKLVLISTIDVLERTTDVYEDDDANNISMQPYGRNRYELEQWVRERYCDSLVIRLPALYGQNIKKNFIYDYMNVIPNMLSKEKFYELASKDTVLEKFYELQANGYYKCKTLNVEERVILRDSFRRLNFSAVRFTDSRSCFQFYPLARLWNDIQVALSYNIRVFHPATEPISSAELYMYLSGTEFVNELENRPAFYNYKTKYAEYFGGQGGYLMRKEEVLEDIRRFVQQSYQYGYEKRAE